MKVLRNVQMKSKGNPKTPTSTASSHAPNRVYYFGSFCLNQAEQQLLRNGEPVKLAPKAFDVLLVLVHNRGCLVTKEKLLEEVWQNTFVEEANLSVNIASLRKALDEGDARQHRIETVPKRGYRFVAPVTELTYEGATPSEEPQPVEGQKDQDLNSIAVLPFENEGCGVAGEYLSAGLTESITNSLSQSRELRVMARNTVYSRHRCNTDPRAVGQELGVRSVLVGRILKLDDNLIVRTELIDVTNGWQLWGHQYQTTISDILIIQQELTAQISRKLRNRLAVDKQSLISRSGEFGMTQLSGGR
jgi:DNA-binding winged helix-turn-helix (wHTH) protein